MSQKRLQTVGKEIMRLEYLTSSLQMYISQVPKYTGYFFINKISCCDALGGILIHLIKYKINFFNLLIFDGAVKRLSNPVRASHCFFEQETTLIAQYWLLPGNDSRVSISL